MGDFIKDTILINHIKYYRIKRNYSQSKLSDITGISQNTISDYENYKCYPNIIHSFKLAYALRVSLYDLFWYDYDNHFSEVDDD